MALRISVVICLYNRADVIRGCLESLAAQEFRDFEVIVVDNNSTDASAVLVRGFAEKDARFRLVTEMNQGVAFCRNRGWREASGEFIAYMDDDGRAMPDWLSVMNRIIMEQNPDIFGGPIRPFHTSPAPAWWKDDWETRVHAPATGWMNDDQYISGSNLIIRRSLLERLNGFDTASGMKGSVIAYGEEPIFMRRARAAGARVYYDHALANEHHVPDFKKQVLYWLYARYRSGYDSVRIFNKRVGFRQCLRIFHVFRSVFDLLGGELRRTERTVPFEQWAVEELAPRFFELGELVGGFYRLKRKARRVMLPWRKGE